MYSIDNMKFLYKAQKMDGIWVKGRVGMPRVVVGGEFIEDREVETCFYAYNGDKKARYPFFRPRPWTRCIVKTDTITPLENISL